MKLALLQCDALPHNPKANAENLARLCRETAGADLCLAPACALTGPGDHCNCDLAEGTLHTLAQAIAGLTPLLCGLAHERLFLLDKGHVVEVRDNFRLGSITIGIAGICVNANLLIDLRGWRYYPEALSERQAVLASHAANSGALACAVNLCGGFGGNIYSGQSIALTPQGELIARGRAFEEEILLVDTEGKSPVAPLCTSVEQAQWLALNLGLADFVHKAGACSALVGLSGGMDSALVATIACSALGADQVTGIIMPSVYTSRQSITDAAQLAHNLGMQTFTVGIEPMVSSFRNALAEPFDQIAAAADDLTWENLQARIRSVILMAFSNRSGALVLNTGNKSEAAMGYSTLYGDTAGAVAVIGDLFKTQVYRVARWYNEQADREVIPEAIFTKAPSAELRPNQKDTDSLPPYEILDPGLENLLKGQHENAALLAKARRAAFKRRQCPPPLLVSSLPLADLC